MDPQDVAHFLYKGEGLNKTAIGKFYYFYWLKPYRNFFCNVGNWGIKFLIEIKSSKT